MTYGAASTLLQSSTPATVLTQLTPGAQIWDPSHHYDVIHVFTLKKQKTAALEVLVLVVCSSSSEEENLRDLSMSYSLLLWTPHLIKRLCACS